MRKNLTPISTPDFNSVYESMGEVLRSVPAQQRQKYVDAYLLTGDGAQKLVAAMYKDNPALMSPQPQMQAPQGTVIGNMAQQVAAAPEDMGIAQLPVENIDEEAFATGGIVAFDEGGEVPGFAGPQGSLVQVPIGGTGIAPLNSITDTTGVASQIKAALEDAKRQIVAKQRKGLLLTKEESDFLTSQGFVDSAVNRKYADKPQFIPGTEPQVKPAESTITGKLGKDDVSDVGKDFASSYNTKSTTPEKDKNIGSIPAVPDLMSSFKGLQVTDVKPLTKEDFGIGERPTMKGIASLRKDAYKEANIDESVYNERLDDVKRRLTGIEGDRKDAVANALVMAGLGIAGGKSQFALTNVAEGALPAFKEYRADLRDLRDREDRVKESEFAVKDARMKFRQTGTDKDLELLESRDKEYRNATRDLATANKNLEADKAKRTDEMNKLGIEVAFKQAGLNLQRYSAETQRMVANRPDLTTAALNMLNGSEKFKGASGDEKLQMFQDLFFSLKGRSTGAGSKGYTYLAQLEKPFGDPTHPLGREYKKISKEKGLAAAEKYKADTIAKQAKAAGIQYGDAGFDAGANVIDFGSLPD